MSGYPTHETKSDLVEDLAGTKHHEVSDGTHTGLGNTKEDAVDAYNTAVKNDLDHVSNRGIFQSWGSKTSR